MIRKAKIKDSEQISKLMLKDLEKPNTKFPEQMIKQLTEHASVRGVKKEFNNNKLIAFVFEDNNIIKGFTVGYIRENNEVFLHYVNGNSKKIKKKLVKYFEKECKKLNIQKIKTDTFEFMENKLIFEEESFKFIKSEKITEDLEILWYEKIIAKKS
jgi:N-acetylglutamate synthase-like GNAT family acetyltransferase